MALKYRAMTFPALGMVTLNVMPRLVAEGDPSVRLSLAQHVLAVVL